MVAVKANWKQIEGWLQQNNMIYVGLIGIGIVLVQPFLTEDSHDASALICIGAFALAMPLLAFLMMINQMQSAHRYAASTRYVSAIQGIALLSGCTGVVAAFWHMSWVAGVIILVSGAAGLSAYSAYYARLERDLGMETRETP